MEQPDHWLEHYGERRSARRSRRLRVALQLAALACAVAVAVAVLAGRSDGWKPPSGLGGFRECTYGGRISARCADLRVPELAAKPGGRAISLHLAIIPATRQPARGALFYLEGGPGGAASEVAVKVNEVFGKVSEYRDLVLVDQRGTGGSHRLTCPQERVPAVDAAAVAAYVRRCFAQLGGEARHFTSAAAADDLERVRRMLGYGRIDLYGSSYGATLAQLYLQRHPYSVRTATLDGASLPTNPVYELAARNAERALRVDVSRCQTQAPACLSAFPDPRAELDRVLAQHPERSDGLASAIAALLRSPEDAARVPLLIHEAAAGDDAPLRREHAALVGAELDARARLAMVWTILCREPWARFGETATAEAGRGSFLAHASGARARVFHQACAAVSAGAAHAPPARSSAAPVLLLAGSADPLDPPENLRGWRKAFPNGRLVTAPGLGHVVVAYGCLRLVVARFIDAGSARGLDAECARHVPLPPFELL